MQSDFEEENSLPENEESHEEGNGKEVPRRPAVVINIYSWVTPIIAVVMLVVGLLGGYFGRPFIKPEEKAESVVSSTTQNQPVPTTGPTDEQRQEMMNFLMGQVRHFKGDPDATVTIIEFSDFQ
jgi:hypothetical protein